MHTIAKQLLRFLGIYFAIDATDPSRYFLKNVLPIQQSINIILRRYFHYRLPKGITPEILRTLVWA